MNMQQIFFGLMALTVMAFIVIQLPAETKPQSHKRMVVTVSDRFLGHGCQIRELCRSDDRIDFDYIEKASRELPEPQMLNETGFENLIVPNIAHLIHFDECHLPFIVYLTIKSVMVNHGPDAIMIHTNCDELQGPYWWKAQSDLNGHKIVSKRLKKPVSSHDERGVLLASLTGTAIKDAVQASQLARLDVLMKYGGIYLDSDVIVLMPLDSFMHFEFAIPVPEDNRPATSSSLSSSIIFAHKNARFLRKWRDLYRRSMDVFLPHEAADRLATTEILRKEPHLAHAVPYALGYNAQSSVARMFAEKISYRELCKDYFAFHVAYDRRSMVFDVSRPAAFNETNIDAFNCTFTYVAREILRN